MDDVLGCSCVLPFVWKGPHAGVVLAGILRLNSPSVGAGNVGNIYQLIERFVEGSYKLTRYSASLSSRIFQGTAISQAIGVSDGVWAVAMEEVDSNYKSRAITDYY